MASDSFPNRLEPYLALLSVSEKKNHFRRAQLHFNAEHLASLRVTVDFDGLPGEIHAAFEFVRVGGPNEKVAEEEHDAGVEFAD